MGDLSKNFSRSEFECSCSCGQDTVDAELVNLLEEIRYHFKARITITSANRCEEYNTKVGGKPNSQHLLSKAADIIVHTKDPHAVADWLFKTYPGCYGVGKYDNFTHVDSRLGPARWGF